MSAMSFSLRLALALTAGIAMAVIVAPIAAVAVATAGFHIPFPRIFDRTVMVTFFAAILLAARRLELRKLLSRGFARPFQELSRSIRGFAVAIAVVAILFVAAFVLGGRAPATIGAVLVRVPGYLLSGVVVAIIEEGFFRAFLLGGMEGDFGSRGALLASSAIYAVAHLVRAPARFYVTGFEPLAGVHSLSSSTAQLAHPIAILPSLLGLFLLGIVLGAAFIVTGTVYFSAGLHAGLVLGAKLWPKLVAGRAAIPPWLAGYGGFPLISGVAAWAAAILILLALRRLSGGSRRRAI